MCYHCLLNSDQMRRVLILTYDDFQIVRFEPTYKTERILQNISELRSLYCISFTIYISLTIYRRKKILFKLKRSRINICVYSSHFHIHPRLPLRTEIKKSCYVENLLKIYPVYLPTCVIA